MELDRREPSPPWRPERQPRTHQDAIPRSYWEMDQEELQQLHKHSKSFESVDGGSSSNNNRGKRSAKRSGRKK